MSPIAVGFAHPWLRGRWARRLGRFGLNDRVAPAVAPRLQQRTGSDCPVAPTPAPPWRRRPGLGGTNVAQTHFSNIKRGTWSLNSYIITSCTTISKRRGGGKTKGKNLLIFFEDNFLRDYYRVFERWDMGISALGNWAER